LEHTEEEFYKSFTIEILKGKNLLLSKFPEPIVGNPFIRITVNTKKGKKTRNTKVKLKEVNPIWHEEKFSFYGVFFPVECFCVSSTVLRKKSTKSEELKTSSKEIMGHFTIQKEHLPRSQQILRRWYYLENETTSLVADENGSGSGGIGTRKTGKILVQMTASKE